MAQVEVTIPKMLATLVRDVRTFTVEAATVAGVVDAVCARHPELRVHIFDEPGEVRPHVSCFHNEVSADLAAPTEDGDTVVILQAVSGG